MLRGPKSSSVLGRGRRGAGGFLGCAVARPVGIALGDGSMGASAWVSAGGATADGLAGAARVTGSVAGGEVEVAWSATLMTANPTAPSKPTPRRPIDRGFF